MVERTQINFRVDNSLLAAIKTQCESQGISQTDFITNAIVAALGLSPTSALNLYSHNAMQLVNERIAQLDSKLDSRITEAVEKLYNQLDDKIAKQLDIKLLGSRGANLGELQA